MAQQDPSESSGNAPNSTNLTAPEALVQALQRQVNEQDVKTLIQSQKHMLTRFEKTNEMLVNCNALLASRYSDASKDLKKHAQLLIEMKKDLDSIFRRIRFLKMKLCQQYPTAFSACTEKFNVLEEEEERDESVSSKAIDAAAAVSSSSPSQESSSPALTSPSTSDS